MLVIKGTQDIFVSRGDNVKLGINLITKESLGVYDYEMAVSEYLIFRLWDERMQRELKQIHSEIGTSIIHITPDFTEGLKGRYAYSVDLIFDDGTKETVVGKSPSTIAKFIVLEA